MLDIVQLLPVLAEEPESWKEDNSSDIQQTGFGFSGIIASFLFILSHIAHMDSIA